MLSKALEKPLSRHEKSLRGYASARVLEALLESMLALEFPQGAIPGMPLVKPSRHGEPLQQLYWLWRRTR